MHRARRHIELKQVELAHHPFLQQLARALPIEQVGRFVPQVAFFVMAFQDLNRIIAQQASAPRLRALLQRHSEEEVGHDGWFLRDLQLIAGGPPSIEVLFGEQHLPTRLATYSLVSEALRAAGDVERLCFMLTLEATSDVCFGAAQTYFQGTGMADRLTFFAGPHLQAEKEHSVWDDEMQAILMSLQLDDALLESARGVIDRTYAAMNMMLDGLARTIEPATPAG
jgi:hypothetical protein